MSMNQIIQQKRKELGLTQEQIAQYLNVTAPAVNKWEKGIHSPDIALLPALARLLKTDLNELFSFQEELSPEEIRQFCREITEIVKQEGISLAFAAVREKHREYPYQDSLLHITAIQLDGLLSLADIPEEALASYRQEIQQWYLQLAKSSDATIQNSAQYLLASGYIQKGEYHLAQQTIDAMPDKNDLLSNMADKQLLQVSLYQKQNQPEKAAEALERMLLSANNKVEILLFKLADAEIACGNIENAKRIAKITQDMAGIHWNYSSYISALQIAVYERDVAASLSILQEIMDAFLCPWNPSSSPLYSRITSTSTTRDGKQMLRAFLTELKRDSSYTFLHTEPEFKKLIAQYEPLC